MTISIYHCLEGAKVADGVVVVFDVFRASNTIIALLHRGAEYIVPIADLEDAFKLKESNPNHLLFGERGGLPPQGFDYGNSPATVSKLNLEGQKIILTTSAGSQGIVGATNADQLLIGSFANAGAIINYLKTKNFTKISLLAIGNNAIEPAIEDEECAKYLKSQLESVKYRTDEMKSRILKSDGAVRLRRLHQEDDLEYCLQVNTSKIVPKYNRKTGKITGV